MKRTKRNELTGQQELVNVNPETGIRYGVVSLDSLQDWVFDEFFHHGTNETWAEAIRDYIAENPGSDEEDASEALEHAQFEEEVYSLEKDGMKLQLSYLGGAPLVWVFESPHKAMVRECSPCVPNAGDLNSKIDGGFECYDVPAEWYRTED